MQQLIDTQQWQNARRVLYMSHVAIGDYYYQRTYLAALCEQYPAIQLDIWFDDCRHRPKNWHAGRNQTLCQWLVKEPHIHQIYPIPTSKQGRDNAIAQARAQNYDIIIFMAQVRSEQYARIARRISENALVVGTKTQQLKNWFTKLLAFRRVDAFITLPKKGIGHINEIYQRTFSQLFGSSLDLNVPVKALTIPIAQQRHIQQWLTTHSNKQGVDKPPIKKPNTVVINHLSTNQRRDLPWKTVVQVIQQMSQANPGLLFIINVPPAEVANVSKLLTAEAHLINTAVEVFSATDDFFHLLALLKLSRLVITVETAIMHLTSGLGTPQIVLMRKQAEKWRPANVSKVLLATKRVQEIPAHAIAQAANEVLIKE